MRPTQSRTKSQPQRDLHARFFILRIIADKTRATSKRAALLLVSLVIVGVAATGFAWARPEIAQSVFSSSTLSAFERILVPQQTLTSLTTVPVPAAEKLAPLAGPTDVSYTAMTTIVCPAEPVATISPAVAGLTFSQISRGSGVTCSAAGGSISGSGFNGNLATNIAGSKWYKFSITSDASTTFTVSNLSIVSRVSSATGSPNDSVQYSIGGTSPTNVIGSFTPTTSAATYVVTPGSPISVGASQTISIYIIPNNLAASTTTSRVENNTFVTVTTTPVGGTPTKLAITSISPTSPTAGSGFNVTVQSQDGSSVAQNVTASTGFTLTTNGNAGTIGGTTTGTITAGTNQVVVSGVTLSTPGTGATITATRTSGDVLTAGTSAPFNVIAGLASEPTTQATALLFSSVGQNSMTLTWTNGNGSNRIVLGKTGAAVDGNPVDGTSYTADSAFGSGSQIGSGNFVVYNSTGNSVTVTNLAGGTTYHFAVFEFNGSAGTENYLTSSPATNNQATPVATYTWNAVGSAPWTTSTNWTPTRTAPGATDILQFNAGGSVTATSVPAQTIGQLLISGNTAVTLQAGGTNTLAISGGSGADLDVVAGSALNVDTASVLTIAEGAVATGSISGSMSFSGGLHRLTSGAASAITFNSGGSFTQGTGCTGNVFGSSGTAGGIVFANGSTFTQNDGSNPFAVAGALVVFNPTSSFLFQVGGTGSPSLSGRTYGNLEINTASTGMTNMTGGNPLVMSDLKMTSGTANFNLTGGITIKGNLTSSSGASLGFSPVSANSLTFNGTAAQTIDGTGTLTFGASTNIIVNNAIGVTLQRDLAFNGVLTLTTDLTVASGFVLTENGTSTGSGDVVGTVRRTDLAAAAQRDFGNPNVEITIVSGDITAMDVTFQKGAPGGFASAVQRYYALEPVTGSVVTDATVKLHYRDSELQSNDPATLTLWRAPGGTWTDQGTAGITRVTGSEPDNWVQKTGVTGFSPWTLASAPQAPTAVKLTSFKAVENNGEVMLQWQTGYEARNLGYNIYREQDGKRVAITPSLVAGSALVAGRQTRLGAGFSYTWYDDARGQGEWVKGNGGATYWLEDLDLNGTRTLHGPIVPEVSYAKQKGRELRADLMSEVSRRTTPNAVQIKGWAGNGAGAGGTTAGVAKQNNGESMFADPSDIQHDLAGMAGVKLAISNAGWYRVTQAELAAAGFTPADLKQLQLYRNGREVAISLSNNNSFTSGDYLEFYGEGLDSTTASAQTYYLVNGRGNGQRINAVSGNANPGDPSGPQSFAYTVERKERMIYFSGLRNGEGENFFGQIVSMDPVSANVPVNNLSGSSAQLEVVLQGVTNENHLVHVVFNGADLGTIDFANTDHPSRKFTVPAAALHEGDNALELTSLGSASDVSLIDVVRLTYNRNLVASDNALAFSVDSRNARRISGFTNPNVRVFDVSDTSSPVELKAVIAPEAPGYAALVEVKQASTLSQRTLLAIAGGQARQVDSIRANVPSALWSQNAGANYVLITTGELKSAVESLAQLRRSQGMTVAVVDVEDIYDEFSFGKHSPEAIRSFLQRATKSWKRQPHFVLFAGDASYDPKNYLGQGLNDLVPTKLIDTSLTETASDDWLADFNNDGISDLAIGRLPVRTAAEAGLMVSKIVSYENTAIDPSRAALLVADTNFEATNNTMKSLIPAGQPVQIINRSATDDAAAHAHVIAGLNQGPRLANYFGHGSNGIWSGAGLLSSNDAPSLTNTDRLSVFTMMTCFNGYFHDAYNESLSEALLKSNGGAVAVWASTSLTEPAGQNVIGAEFYRMLFGAQPVTLGDAARTAKSFTGDADVRRTWTLFGDPATRLR